MRKPILGHSSSTPQFLSCNMSFRIKVHWPFKLWLKCIQLLLSLLKLCFWCDFKTLFYYHYYYFFFLHSFCSAAAQMRPAVWSSRHTVDSFRIPRHARLLSHSSPSSNSIPQRAAFEDAHLTNDNLTSVKSSRLRPKCHGFCLDSPCNRHWIDTLHDTSMEWIGKKDSGFGSMIVSVIQLGGSFPPLLFFNGLCSLRRFVLLPLVLYCSVIQATCVSGTIWRQSRVKKHKKPAMVDRHAGDYFIAVLFLDLSDWHVRASIQYKKSSVITAKHYH